MNCPNCNSVVSEGSRFCENCGTKLETQATAQTPVQPTNQVQPVAPVSPKKPLDKRIIIAAAAAFVFIMITIVSVATHKHKINLNDYVKVEFEGYETFGKAKVTFDYNAFYTELSEHAKVSKKDAAQFQAQMKDSDLGNFAEQLSNLSESVSYLGACQGLDWNLSKDSELKNGEKVKLSFTFNNEAAKKYGIKFTGKEKEYTVEGLKEIEVVDAFADIKVTFTGISPNASVTIENNSSIEAVKNQNFYVDNNGGIKKGDTVTVKVDVDENNLLTQYGCKFKETSKTYTCENVDEYVTDGSQLTEEVLTGMKDQTKDVIDAYLANNKDNFKGSNVNYVGYYFLSKKEESQSWGENNFVYIVYSVKVKSKDKQFKESTVYMPVRFSNVIKYADGTDFVDLNQTDIHGTTDLSFGWWNKVEGYTKESDMKNELVTSQKSTYNAASFEGLQ